MKKSTILITALLMLCSMIYEVFASTDEEEASMVGVCPNPSTGIVNVTTNGSQRIAVYKMAGQCFYQDVSEGTLQLDLKPFGFGVYAIKAGDQVWRAVVR